MPRNPKRKPNARAYKGKYTNQDLIDAISAVQRGTMKSWKAALEYGIPQGTLINKLKDIHARKQRIRSIELMMNEWTMIILKATKKI